MPLRGKILVVLSITLALLVAGLYALANATVMKGFVELEADSMKLDVRRVRDALAQEVLGLVEKSGVHGARCIAHRRAFLRTMPDRVPALSRKPFAMRVVTGTRDA